MAGTISTFIQVVQDRPMVTEPRARTAWQTYLEGPVRAASDHYSEYCMIAYFSSVNRMSFMVHRRRGHRTSKYRVPQYVIGVLRSRRDYNGDVSN